MSFWERLINGFRAILPSPFAIALLLTATTFLLAFAFTKPEGIGAAYFIDIAIFWEQGLWNPPLLAFAVQMMLMLVLGHALALTQPFSKLIYSALRYCNNTSNSAVIVAFITMLVGFFNWGLALIFGAIFARKVAEHAHKNQFTLNYPLVGAAGYSGMMVWHGGLSGSSLVKVAEPGHLKTLVSGIDNGTLASSVPDAITFSDTVFSSMNLCVSGALLLFVPAGLWLISRLLPGAVLSIPNNSFEIKNESETKPEGAEKLDYSKWFARVFGVFILSVAAHKAFSSNNLTDLGFITPDYINLILLALCLMFHENLFAFGQALTQAVTGATGILIQFPLYFGIMGIMNNSGLVAQMADFFISISNQYTYPIFTFLSAGLVNFFVPSGGGQWLVQGPIVVKAAAALDVDLAKSILSLAYGDQITNMLQPFWALPLLGITGLKAKDLLPYTAFTMLIGLAIFSVALLVF
jgi:short-chain fatty acids transporter